MRRDDAIAFAKLCAAPTLHRACAIAIDPTAILEIDALRDPSFAQLRTPLQTLAAALAAYAQRRKRCPRAQAFAVHQASATGDGTHSAPWRRAQCDAVRVRPRTARTFARRTRTAAAARRRRGNTHTEPPIADPAPRLSAARASAPPCRDGTLHANRGSA
jgi:hypothetical protein